MVDKIVGPVHYHAKTTITELPSGERYILVTISFTCPVCGEITMELPGHHLRSIYDLLSDQLAQFPELMNKSRERHEVQTLQAMLANHQKETTH